MGATPNPGGIVMGLGGQHCSALFFSCALIFFKSGLQLRFGRHPFAKT